MAGGRSGATAFSEHCEWTGASSEDRENWLLARRQGIGGSDVAAALGYSEWKSPLALYVEKTATTPPDDSATEAAEWGRILEAPILREYGKRSARKVVRAGRLLRSKQATHHLVTLDGVQLSKAPPWAKGAGVAEVKTTGYGSSYAEDLPVDVQLQIQWELWVTGASWATCIWLPFPERRLQWIDVEPHPDFGLIAEKVDAFWQRVLRREPPDPDGSESSRLALRALYPEQTEEVIRITGAKSLVDEYEQNKVWLEALTTRQQLIKNMFAATIRDAKYAVLDDGRYWGAAYYKARDNRCPHCQEVLSHVEPYRTLTLREPRKKPFPLSTAAVRRLPETVTANPVVDEEALTKVLAESVEVAANNERGAA